MLPVLIFGIRVYWYLLYLCTIWVKKRYFPEKYFPGPNSIWQLWLLLIMLFYCVLFWQRTQLLILEGGWRSGIFEKTMKPPSFSHVIFFGFCSLQLLFFNKYAKYAPLLKAEILFFQVQVDLGPQQPLKIFLSKAEVWTRMSSQINLNWLLNLKFLPKVTSGLAFEAMKNFFSNGP